MWNSHCESFITRKHKQTFFRLSLKIRCESIFFNEIVPWPAACTDLYTLSCAGHFHDVYILLHGFYFQLDIIERKGGKNQKPSAFNAKLFQFAAFSFFYSLRHKRNVSTESEGLCKNVCDHWLNLWQSTFRLANEREFDDAAIYFWTVSIHLHLLVTLRFRTMWFCFSIFLRIKR